MDLEVKSGAGVLGWIRATPHGFVLQPGPELTPDHPWFPDPEDERGPLPPGHHRTMFLHFLRKLLDEVYRPDEPPDDLLGYLAQRHPGNTRLIPSDQATLPPDLPAPVPYLDWPGPNRRGNPTRSS